MDQGIITVFKSYYRKRLVNRYLAAILNKEDVKYIKINIKKAVDMFAVGWEEMTNATISNWFGIAGFVKLPQNAKEITVDINTWSTAQENLHSTVTFKEYISVDSGVTTTESVMEEEIVYSVSDSKNV